jgi:hypothetical protein
MAAEIPAGWYPNPWNDAEELYWSGAEWTGISRAAHRSGPAVAPPVLDEIEDSTIMRPARRSARSMDTPLMPIPLVAGGADEMGPAPISPIEQSYPTRPYGDQQFDDLTHAAAALPQEAGAPHGAGMPQSAGMTQGADALHSAETPLSETHLDAPTAGNQDAPAPFAPPTAPPAYVSDGVPATYAPPAYAAPPTQLPPPGSHPQPFPGDAWAPAAQYADSADAATIRWALNDNAPAAPVSNPRAKFGLIAMIVGIAAAVFAVIPGLSFAAWVPAFAAIALGIVGYLGGKPRGFALTGIIVGGAALAVATAISIWFLTQLGVLAH